MAQLEKMSLFLKYCLQVTFIFGVFIIIFLRDILTFSLPYQLTSSPEYIDICVKILTPCAFLDLIILWELISIMKTITIRTSFVEKNVCSFRNIALCCIGTAILLSIKLFFYSTVFTLALTYILLIAGLSALVFSQLFKKAVDYKTENDLTI